MSRAGGVDKNNFHKYLFFLKFCCIFVEIIKYNSIMATINLLKLKQALPYGSLARIAKATGLSPKIVSEVFNNGWHYQHRAAVCDAALSILDEQKTDPDIMKHAEEHGMVSPHSIYVPQRKKKRSVVYEEEEDITWDDLVDMDFEELVDLCEEWELETDPEDHEPGFLTSREGREDELREEIAEELGIEIGDSKDYDDEEEEEEEE